MDKQTTLAFVLIGAVLIIWLYITSPDPGKQPPVVQKDTTTVVQKDTVPVVPTDAVLAEQKEEQSFGRYFSASGEEGQIVTVENDLVRFELNTKGANFSKYFLKEYNNWYSAGEDDSTTVTRSKVQLINYSRGNAFDLAFVTADGKAIQTSSMTFQYDNNSNIKVSGSDSVRLVFTLPAATGGSIKKIFTVYGNQYGLKTDIELSGMQNLISNNTYDLVWESGIRFVELNSIDEANFSNASVFYGGEQVVVDASDPGETVEKDFTGRVDWIGIRNKYFSVILSPDNPDIEGAYIKGSKSSYQNTGVREFYSGRLIIPFKNTDYEKRSFTMYVGPVDYDILKTYNRNFEAIVDFGSFFGLKFIVRPIAEFVLLPLFNFLHSFIPNYGFVIIVFSLIIKFVLYPLTKSSYQSMKKMQLLQPKMAEIKEKYKDDPQKMNKEMMGLYGTYGINPAGGCLPLLLQMPIFVALWGLFQVAIDLRQQPFMLWINDLSRPDVIYELPFKVPLFGIDQISGLALLMGITTFFQQKMSVKDPKQQSLVYIMPVFLTLMFMSFPSGLNLYYFMFNIFSIAQQYYINHKHTDMVLEPVKKTNKKKGGFMARLMEAAEQKQKEQQQLQRKKKKF
jgi:YidC/Oxa1 family membrane protein insertase